MPEAADEAAAGQVPLGLGVGLALGTLAVVVLPGPAESRRARLAQRNAAYWSLLLPAHRTWVPQYLPLVMVMGAVPAYPLRDAALGNRLR